MNKKKRKGKLSTQICLLSALSMILVVVVIVAVTNVILKHSLLNDNASLLHTTAKENVNSIDGWLEQQATIIEVMAQTLVHLNSTDHEMIMDYLENQLSQNDQALMYYVCFAYDKSVLPADHSHVDLDPTQRPWWKESIEKQGIICTSPYSDSVTKQSVVSMAMPLTIDGQQAVILADITISHLVSIVNSIEINKATHTFLLDKDGIVITHYNPDYLPSEDINTILSDFVSFDISSKEVQHIVDYDGQKDYLVLSEIPFTGWYIGIVENENYINRQIQGSINSSIIAAAIIVCISLILLLIIVNQMLKPVPIIVNAIDNISKGNFSIQLEKTKRPDEIGELQNSSIDLIHTLSHIIGDANHILGDIAHYNLNNDDMRTYPGEFNQLTDSINCIKHMLNEILTEVQQSAADVENSSGQLSMVADNLSEGTTVQAASIDKLQEEINDITEAITRNSDNCNLVNDRLSNLETQAKDGNSEMDLLLHEVEFIENMSNDIQTIVSTIDSISFQTNILALNAAVEAARVGQNGKGFAVVAEEVRNLAYKCGEESKKTAELIDNCIKSIKNAKAYADTTSQCMSEVVNQSTEIAFAFQTIYHDTSEQAQSSENIKSEIINISDVVQTTTATTEETAASSKLLSEQALGLAKMVSQFKLKK